VSALALQTSHWIRSRTWDSFWLLSGFWIPTLLLFVPIDGIKPLTIVVTLLFWMGHRISSLYLGFCVGEYREVVQARRHYFLSFPLFLLCLLAGFLLVPESVIPLSLLHRFVLLAFFDYFLSLYHFRSSTTAFCRCIAAGCPRSKRSRAAALGLVGVHWRVGNLQRCDGLSQRGVRLRTKSSKTHRCYPSPQ
jgi:hypothetical protein